MTGRALEVFINDRKVGTLRETNDLWQFDYEPDWALAADGFDLSPELRRATLSHIDGASERPVQWYFDNLLPEEALRTALAEEEKIPEADAFGLLAHFGAESAGSLVLRQPGSAPSAETALRPLHDDVLYERIQNLPRVSLNHDSPKHMSLAGAQHKLPVVLSEGRLYEPEKGAVSTHILKPDHPGQNYPSSVINEFFIMRLAKALDLNVPAVYRHYCPAPVYIVERFDRLRVKDTIQRQHMIDTCQLLNKSRTFKYTEATVESLQQVIPHIRIKAAARLWLFQWLVFNALVGNGDNHLKNISYMVSAEGIQVSPGYDLLSTAVYATKGYAEERATWPNSAFALPFPGTKTFAEVNRATIFQAAGMLGLTAETAGRELDRLVKQILPMADELIMAIEKENSARPAHLHAVFAGEMAMLRTIRHIIIAEMVNKLQ